MFLQRHLVRRIIQITWDYITEFKNRDKPCERRVTEGTLVDAASIGHPALVLGVVGRKDRSPDLSYLNQPVRYDGRGLHSSTFQLNLSRF